MQSEETKKGLSRRQLLGSTAAVAAAGAAGVGGALTVSGGVVTQAAAQTKRAVRRAGSTFCISCRIPAIFCA